MLYQWTVCSEFATLWVMKTWLTRVRYGSRMLVSYTLSCVLTDFRSWQVGTDCNLLVRYTGVGIHLVCSVFAGVGTKRALLCPQRNFGRHIVIALYVCPSVPLSCPVHIFYILWGRNSKFGMWIHLGMAECLVPFLGHCALDLDLRTSF